MQQIKDKGGNAVFVKTDVTEETGMHKYSALLLRARYYRTARQFGGSDVSLLPQKRCNYRVAR